MTSAPKFDVVFSGNIAEGFALDQVKRKAAQLFKMDDKKIAAIFGAGSIALKKNLDQVSALKYQKILAQAGMLVDLREQGGEDTQTTANHQSVKQGGSFEDWSLDEVGVLLMPPKPAVVAKVNAPEYTLAAQPCNILTAEELPPEPVVPDLPLLDSLTIADVGTQLLEMSEKATIKELQLDLSHLSTKAAGAALLDDSEKREAVSSTIDTSAIKLVD